MTDLGDVPVPAARSGEGDTIVRGTALSFAAKLVGGLLTGVLTVFLARRLGSSGYGVFALALSVEALLSLLADAGITQSVQRFVAENRNHRRLVAEIVGDAMRLKMLSSIVIAAVLMATAGVIADAYHAPNLTWVLRGTAVVIVGKNFLLMTAGIFTAMRRQAMTLMSFTLESVVEVAASIALVLIAGGAAAAVSGRAIGYLFGMAAGLALMFRLLRPATVKVFARPRRHTRQIARDAVALLVVDGVYAAFDQIDSLLIGAFLTVTSVGIWQAPGRLVALLVYPGQAITSAVAPRMARFDQHPAEPEAFAGAVRFLILLMAGLTAITTVWATPIIQLLLGPSFRESADVLRALAPFVFLSGLGPLVSVGMNYIGQARRRIPIAVATLLLNLIIDLILIPRIGVLGGAVGTDAALLIYVTAHFEYCRRALHVPLGPSVLTLGRSLLAAGVMAVVLSAFSTERLSIPELLIGGVLGTGAYAVVVLATREVSPGELARVWAAARGRWPLNRA